METQATIKYLQVGKGWMWKLFDATGSVIAKSDFNAPFATEAEAMEAFEAWQADGGETVEATPAPLPESAPVAPEATGPVEPEVTEPTPAPENVPVEPTPEAPVEATPEAPVSTETTGTEPVPAETPSDAGTVEPAPVEDAGSVTPTE